MKTILVDDVIDAARIGSFHVTLFAICFLICLFDGANTQAMGLIGPLVAADLHFSSPQMGFTFAASEVGFMLGALLLGPVADHFGPKKILVLCALMIGVSSFLTAHAMSFPVFFILRLSIGLGVGGAAPCCVSITTEYFPERFKTAAATLLWAANPAGGMMSGFIAHHLVPIYGWKATVYLNGLVPVVMAVTALTLMPESARYLIRSKHASKILNRIVRRIDVSREHLADAMYIVKERIQGGGSAKLLFQEGRAAFTPLLWLTFYLTWAALVATLSWTSTLLHNRGMNVQDTALVMGFNNVGGMIGVAIAGATMNRFGRFKVMIIAYILGACAVSMIGYGGTNVDLIALLSVATGLLVGGTTGGLIATAATVYPAQARTVGVAWGLAAGRIGGACGPVIIGVLIAWGVPTNTLFLVIGLMVAIAAITTSVLRAIKKDEKPISVGLVSSQP
ncbi:MFS transporter [Paraburkholderia sediminicola]|uniref:MFS transporter n=1 Tax=Paraburkholderia metrosideri TaxID=580937 RepID=A0ABW9DSK4_9BURK